eukprot:2046971-Rhodomonas_salina.1
MTGRATRREAAQPPGRPGTVTVAVGLSLNGLQLAAWLRLSGSPLRLSGSQALRLRPRGCQCHGADALSVTENAVSSSTVDCDDNTADAFYAGATELRQCNSVWARSESESDGLGPRSIRTCPRHTLTLCSATALESCRAFSREWRALRQKESQR